MDRRRFIAAHGGLGALGALGALSGCTTVPRAPERGPIGAMFVGSVESAGFMEAGKLGAESIRTELGIPTRVLANVAPERESMLRALRELAESDAKLVIAHGAIAGGAAQRIAWEVPKQRFIVMQGDPAHLRPNLAIYEVLHEQGAWLAGALAGLLTRSNVVGHLGDARDATGLAARAAFAGGVAAANPKAKLLTEFAGARADSTIARARTLAQIDAGADIVFAPLENGRAGAVEAARARRVRLIGHGRDWTRAEPDVYAGAAIADYAACYRIAARDLADGVWRGDEVRRFGVRRDELVRLALGDGLPAPVVRSIADYRQDMALNRITVPAKYDGAEFGRDHRPHAARTAASPPASHVIPRGA